MSDALISAWCREEPPTTKGSGDVCEQQGPLTTAASSSAAIAIAHTPSTYGECFVTFIITGNPARLNFGNANVAAADTNTPILPAGKYRFRVTKANNYFRHIQQTGAATIDFWRSSR